MREKLIELFFDYQRKYNSLVVSKDGLADHLIASGVTVQGWIPVSERLPEVRVPVLTCGRKGAIGIGFVQPTSVTPDGKVYFYARYGDSLPTHWMPMPEPPKGE